MCSVPCGDGEQIRTRNKSTAPSHGGKDCIGSDVESSACKIKECPSKKENIAIIALQLY